jgi:hypothetical protein
MVVLMDTVSMCLQLAGGARWSKRGRFSGVDPTKRWIWGLKWGAGLLGRICIEPFFGSISMLRGGERWVVRLVGGSWGAPAMGGRARF